MGEELVSDGIGAFLGQQPGDGVLVPTLVTRAGKHATLSPSRVGDTRNNDGPGDR
ncbi:hypothetical protein ACFY0A_08650 [Streptomyces sp. NPDC001698]|uniref:hypothetical protein n=1 Tax=unclassified Streptomyces TaxID=2593676 RepID=UPI0036C50EF2